MSKQKVELLAPAGNFSCFRAAVNAGADAVYLGGDQYSARAYAGNFSTEEILDALRIAHIFHRKIYLTVNTLVKENELANLVPYIKPLYESGLDGVIVQDIGALECLRRRFPGLALHASTQMTITSIYGAAYMKKLGVCRIVPARELSLDEIKDIKDKTNLEIECFVHGAMCYAYSGQCLFSSILGGRSGNRGRCAGPCRLPYTTDNGRTLYPLSLKDMYTLSVLPELIQTGIDSFKIEGRMKSPEYVAGVTAMYRKYIDQYLEHPDKPYKVAAKDEQLMRELYIRSDICTGYYQLHNDKTMVTLNEPGYSGSSQEVLKTIQKQYILQNILLPVTGHVYIHAGQPALLTLSCDKATVTIEGALVSGALSRPLDESEISKQLSKLGDTCFELTDLTIDTDHSSFMPVRALNELRRMACLKLEDELCSMVKPKISVNHDVQEIFRPKTAVQIGEVNTLCVLTTTVEQLMAANDFHEIRRIYVNSDVFITNHSLEKLLLSEKEYIFVMPHIFRKKSWKYLTEYEKLLTSGRFAGVLVRNLEELEWLVEIEYTGMICSDYTIYTWNHTALDFLSQQFDGITLPLELNRKELDMLSADCAIHFVVYGFIPLMYSANCIRKTLDYCINDKEKENNIYRLTDRYKNVFAVRQNCIHCYNILYNTVPLSLHGQLDSVLKKNYNMLRLDFSIEDKEQTRAVIAFYLRRIKGTDTKYEFPLKEFTNGHYKRGVE
ncbi:MAG: U32 family peptidase [Lachnospiraceae bacterium]|nr:U32 family peptidase [Lachnospiraceae bacterium]